MVRIEASAPTTVLRLPVWVPNVNRAEIKAIQLENTIPEALIHPPTRSPLGFRDRRARWQHSIVPSATNRFGGEYYRTDRA